MVRRQEPTNDSGQSLITVSDVRAAGYCVRGAKDWFAEHDMDFRQFIRHGIDEQEFLTKGDHLARRVVEHKHGKKDT